MNRDFDLLINGGSRAGSTGQSEPVLNPATGESIGRVAYASPEDLRETVATASRGFREWRTVSSWERGRILKKAADIMRADIEAAALTITGRPRTTSSMPDAAKTGKPLFDVLVKVQDVTTPLGLERLRDLTDPANCLGSGNGRSGARRRTADAGVETGKNDRQSGNMGPVGRR